MDNKPKPRLQSKAASKSVRASVTFSAELYSDLERIAEQKKVSVAWVVRDAAEKYVAEQYPLFNKN
jgi:metal-responsive CopG/Arc/MetJ family transcriptional regulator